MAFDILPLLILIGRPASGKSEIIECLRGVPAARRRTDFHLGELVVLDDFPYLWSWMEEDALLEQRLGQPRLHTDSSGYFLYPYLWDLLIERLAHNYRARSKEAGPAGIHRSFILEFSRGSEHGGYRQALARLGEDLLEQAAVMYVSVSFEESLRKNRRRFNPQRPGSILEHSLSEEKMERLYRIDDWGELTQGRSQRLMVGSRHPPYVTFDNEDDLTSGVPEALEARLRQGLDSLHTEWEKSRTR
jgi:hypothetical protein